ncbi:hypothetical protein [Paracoccus beibuensis]|uniref:hypothetical protein n=1 Tax=Paracoccus beibuensis TaxID=547602 RepID=UPI0022401B96|nr:hypothetical protein [Paracoccus beibuensis]
MTTPIIQRPVTRAGGFLAAAAMPATVAAAFTGLSGATALAAAASLAAIACFSIGAAKARLVFVLIGLVQVLMAVAARSDGLQAVGTALGRGGFVISLFTALAAIRAAASGSAEIIACGRFLARQPPGRRYAALTAGGHMFGLILMYGSISLLGSLAAETTSGLRDPELRSLRLRRMLIAIQRGFAATLCWSPLAFSMVIATSLVPGATWSEAVLPCLFSSFLMLAVGWGLDSIFKPKLALPPPARTAEGDGWLIQLRPLLLLLGVVVICVVAIHAATGVSVVPCVMLVVPAVATVWIARQLQAEGQRVLDGTAARIRDFALEELPRFRSEILLLFMAAFIGHMGAYLLVPLVEQSGLDLAQLPPPVILSAVVWLIPLAGQIGMNPILAASLFVPLLPAPAALGIDPAAMIVAITGGWAISGTTSPFTASVLLVGSLSGQSARRVGLYWNGVYALAMGLLLAGWSMIVAG